MMTQVLPTQTKQNRIPLDGPHWSSEPPGFQSPLNGPEKGSFDTQNSPKKFQKPQNRSKNPKMDFKLLGTGSKDQNSPKIARSVDGQTHGHFWPPTQVVPENV